ncbi:DNA repair protein RadA [Specibacter cremeus]|uniref:DNA repair protein RadA n=1 Tax=Specibacter cremeus TaxID=1629051 RepID=UPI000F77FC6E|nr:DNA repair protein RadA [Specibacter cremeus]
MATKTARKPTTQNYRCAECGWTTAKWVGRCGECQAWGTVEELGVVVARTTAATAVARPAQPIADVDATTAAYQPTGVPELDRVLGGGIVQGAVILLAGEPGVGKSTLLLDVAAKFARNEHGMKARKVLYVTGEESAAQVKLRADRIEAVADTLYLTAETDLGTVLGHVAEASPELLIVDSVQTLSSTLVDGSAGGVSQVREVAASLIAAAKKDNMATLLVGHVTKDGSIAGPRLLEHLVDVVCQFDGERHSRLRLLRATKNRYGQTDEVGCFDLTETGIEGLTDPSGLFITRVTPPVSGTCISVALEGRRPLLAEVQALVAESAGQPRRSANGLDSSRMTMMLAVLAARTPVRVENDDVYVATVGGARLTEPAMDLAMALAVMSAKSRVPLPQKLVAFGEVGLAGEVRAVPGINQRIHEAHRLGYTHALVPRSQNGPGTLPPNFMVKQIEHVFEAIELLRAAAAA